MWKVLKQDRIINLKFKLVLLGQNMQHDLNRTVYKDDNPDDKKTTF